MLRSNKKYRLSSGTQVRQEDFGLLFYTMRGPRLYFLPVGTFFDPSFFESDCALQQWAEQKSRKTTVSEGYLKKIEKSLGQLIDKGVILEF
jgi:putative mycofactocin binding protein MftB